MPLDGGALIFVVQPSRSLAGPVAVVGKLTLAAAVEPLLSFEAGVTDDVCQAGRTEGHIGLYLSEGPAPPSEGPARFASLGSSHPLRMDPLRFFGRMEKPPTEHNACALAQCCCFSLWLHQRQIFCLEEDGHKAFPSSQPSCLQLICSSSARPLLLSTASVNRIFSLFSFSVWPVLKHEPPIC